MLRICTASPEAKFREGISIKELSRLLEEPRGRTWIDFCEPTDFENEILASMFGLHPLSIEDCVQEVHHPKLEDYGDYIYCIVHWIVHNDGRDLVSYDVDAFLAKNFLITYRKVPMASIDELLANRERLEDAVTRGLDYLLYVLFDGLARQYMPLLDSMEDRIDRLESEIFEMLDTRQLGKLLAMKRNLLQLRRIAAPQREIFAALSRQNTRYIDHEAALHFRDIYDAFYRIIDTTDLLKDLVNGAMETYLTVSSNRLNEIMKFLTILSTLMMPPTLIAGIYGMNFERMPELKWSYGYLFAMLLIVGTMTSLLAFFRRKGWL